MVDVDPLPEDIAGFQESERPPSEQVSNYEYVMSFFSLLISIKMTVRFILAILLIDLDMQDILQAIKYF